MTPHVQQPFFKSALYFSADAGSIPDALMRGMNVIVLIDVEEAGNYSACFPMSSLLPPPSLVGVILNTDRTAPDYAQTEQFYLQSYYSYMASPIVEDQIVNLLASMYKTNKSALIYTEYDVEMQFRPLQVLTSFFAIQFGINILPYETLFYQQQPPIFNPRPDFIYRIIELLLANNYVTKEEYACILPQDAVPSPRAVAIILSDFNYVFPTMEASLTAACNIIDTYRKQRQTGKVMPVVEMSKALDDVRNQQIQQLINNSNTRFGKTTMGELQSRGQIAAPQQ